MELNGGYRRDREKINDTSGPRLGFVAGILGLGADGSHSFQTRERGGCIQQSTSENCLSPGPIRIDYQDLYLSLE
jgi:hypothetical protein